MPDSYPSAALISTAVREQREELVRHLDAVDTKCGVVLGFSGAVAAVGAQHATPARAPGLALAVVAALMALWAITPQHFPTWEISAMRPYLRADPAFIQREALDTSIEIVLQLKKHTERKVPRLRAAVLLLALAVVATAVGTIFN